MGKTPDTITIDDLAPVDEFHIGGRVASRDFLGQLAISSDDHVLDVGCGIGGASRFTAQEFHCRVTGVDLTEEYVETGELLCNWLGLSSSVSLVQGNVLKLGFPDAGFDKAFMLHVGMNIPDKAALGSEVSRVLKPGGLFGIYDIMKVGGEMVNFPVPWATDAEGSSLGSPDDYKDALSEAGFEIISERNRGDFALKFFAELKARAAAASGPPPLGLHVIMGAEAPIKIQNMVANVAQGTIAPVELIAQKL
ncbi:MAG: class I SAM-dependent methyltransferase [Hellea sp.]|nr:class I SAM-dependent methyltransferase [Hellea sp.]